MRFKNINIKAFVLDIMGRKKTNVGKCLVQSCTKFARTTKYCSMHYARIKRYGTLELTTWHINTKCLVENCTNSHYGLGYCKLHYFRLISNPRYSPRRLNFKNRSILLKENPRSGICSECGKKGMTHIHHDKYDENNPLSHTRELCESCHCKTSWILGQIKGRSKL